MRGFVQFIKDQGIAGVAVGFILGGAVSKLVASIVDNLVNPVAGLALGKVNLADKVIRLSMGPDGRPRTDDDLILKWGALLTTFIDFVVLAAVVYAGVKLLKIDKETIKKK